MNILLMMQESGSAELFVALLMLPWLGIAMMHAFSLGQRDRLDDNFGMRAGAALRWTAQDPDPITPVKSAVLEYRARKPARVHLERRETIEHEAA